MPTFLCPATQADSPLFPSTRTGGVRSPGQSGRWGKAWGLGGEMLRSGWWKSGVAGTCLNEEPGIAGAQ